MAIPSIGQHTGQSSAATSHGSKTPSNTSSAQEFAKLSGGPQSQSGAPVPKDTKPAQQNTKPEGTKQRSDSYLQGWDNPTGNKGGFSQAQFARAQGTDNKAQAAEPSTSPAKQGKDSGGGNTNTQQTAKS